MAAANPCPCGFLGNLDKCRCRPEQVDRYNQKLSGPLLDRIDMQLQISVVSRSEMRKADSMNTAEVETSATIASRVTAARNRQIARQGKPNAHLDTTELKVFCALGDAQNNLLEQLENRFDLSTRGSHKLIKLARTIADLDGQSEITSEHLLLSSRFRKRADEERLS